LVATVPSGHIDILKKKALAVVATIGPDGSPQTSVVGFDWNGNSLRFSTTKSRAKFKHLAKNPRVSILILDPDFPDRYLELRGQAAIAEDADGSLIDELSLRYNGIHWNGPTEGRVIVSLEPSKVIAYRD
jgi:PPOX class probable F420-dependent enzyme